jgi:hypothetical protein
MSDAAAEFDDDLRYLRGLADAVSDRLQASGRGCLPHGPTVEERLIADMSAAAKAAVLGKWPTAMTTIFSYRTGSVSV